MTKLCSLYNKRLKESLVGIINGPSHGVSYQELSESRTPLVARHFADKILGSQLIRKEGCVSLVRGERVA